MIRQNRLTIKVWKNQFDLGQQNLRLMTSYSCFLDISQQETYHWMFSTIVRENLT